MIDMEAEFIESATFAGPKAGYNFKTGPSGLGYYKDDGSQTAVAAPTQQVMLHEDGVDVESVRKCGPLPFGSATAYAKAIPPEQRSVTTTTSTAYQARLTLCWNKLVEFCVSRRINIWHRMRRLHLRWHNISTTR